MAHFLNLVTKVKGTHLIPLHFLISFSYNIVPCATKELPFTCETELTIIKIRSVLYYNNYFRKQLFSNQSNQ